MGDGFKRGLEVAGLSQTDHGKVWLLAVEERCKTLMALIGETTQTEREELVGRKRADLLGDLYDHLDLVMGGEDEDDD